MFNVFSTVSDLWYNRPQRSNRYPNGKFTGLMGRKKSILGWWRRRS